MGTEIEIGRAGTRVQYPRVDPSVEAIELDRLGRNDQIPSHVLSPRRASFRRPLYLQPDWDADPRCTSIAAVFRSSRVPGTILTKPQHFPVVVSEPEDQYGVGPLAIAGLALLHERPPATSE
jgi:hypothetical protein